MNKFLKTAMLVSLILVLVGGILSVAGRVSGGRTQLNNMISRGMLTIPPGHVTGNWDPDWYEEWEFGEEYPVYTEDFDETLSKIQASELEGLVISAGGMRLQVKRSENGKIRLEGYDFDKLQYYVEDGVLYIYADGQQEPGDGNARINLYLPENVSFKQVELEVGAGETVLDFLNTETLVCDVGAGTLQLAQLRADDADITLGMGKLDMEKVQVNSMTFDVGMGSMTCRGKISGDMSGACGMGSVKMWLDGEEKDHNYNLDASMGTVKIGGHDYAGMSTGSVTDYGADSDFDLESSMGSIEIYFTNPG